MTLQLKPCPKCGDKTRYIEREVGETSVKCRVCGHTVSLNPIILKLTKMKGSTATPLKYDGNNNRVNAQVKSGRMLSALSRAVRRKE
jgi:hypothetical protein